MFVLCTVVVMMGRRVTRSCEEFMRRCERGRVKRNIPETCHLYTYAGETSHEVQDGYMASVFLAVHRRP